ncbi:MAG TPA: hypothetical protein VGB71_07940, partial [Flavisolibacter sp.]
KLAAAQKLAQDAGKELIRVDLAQGAKKYVGETEKNLMLFLRRQLLKMLCCILMKPMPCLAKEPT